MKKKIQNIFQTLAWGDSELNEFTYSLNGFINITEIYWQNQHDFFLLYFNIFSAAVRKALFSLRCTHSQHTIVFVLVETKTMKNYIFRFSFSPPASLVFVNTILFFLLFESDPSKRHADLFSIFFLSSLSSNFGLGIYIHTKWGKSERVMMEKWKIMCGRWEGAWGVTKSQINFE